MTTAALTLPLSIGEPARVLLSADELPDCFGTDAVSIASTASTTRKSKGLGKRRNDDSPRPFMSKKQQMMFLPVDDPEFNSTFHVEQKADQSQFVSSLFNTASDLADSELQPPSAAAAAAAAATITTTTMDKLIDESPAKRVLNATALKNGTAGYVDDLLIPLQLTQTQPSTDTPLHLHRITLCNQTVLDSWSTWKLAREADGVPARDSIFTKLHKSTSGGSFEQPIGAYFTTVLDRPRLRATRSPIKYGSLTNTLVHTQKVLAHIASYEATTALASLNTTGWKTDNEFVRQNASSKLAARITTPVATTPEFVDIAAAVATPSAEASKLKGELGLTYQVANMLHDVESSRLTAMRERLLPMLVFSNGGGVIASDAPTSAVRSPVPISKWRLSAVAYQNLVASLAAKPDITELKMYSEDAKPQFSTQGKLRHTCQAYISVFDSSAQEVIDISVRTWRHMRALEATTMALNGRGCDGNPYNYCVSTDCAKPQLTDTKLAGVRHPVNYASRVALPFICMEHTFLSTEAMISSPVEFQTAIEKAIHDHETQCLGMVALPVLPAAAAATTKI